MIEYQTGNPTSVGVYACRVPDCDKPPGFVKDMFLLWIDGKWGYLGSDQNYQGHVLGWAGPLSRARLPMPSTDEEYDDVFVSVEFQGVVRVQVPRAIERSRRRALAEHIALCQVLATVENPDSPADVACGDYQQQFSLTEDVAGSEWDSAECLSISGIWRNAEEAE